ncbi:MAG: hypothetical protein ACLFV6_03375 [Spirulinaceae cyanobacterium]
MKIIRQTDTSLEIRYLPTDEWLGAGELMIPGIYGTIEFNTWGRAFWFLMFLLGSYFFFFWSKIRHCLADQTTQTFYIRDRNLVRTETRQKHFFSEIFNLEIRENRNPENWTYYAYLNLKSGEKIDLGTDTHNKRNLEKCLRPLAKLIDCPYNFVSK